MKSKDPRAPGAEAPRLFSNYASRPPRKQKVYCPLTTSLEMCEKCEKMCSSRDRRDARRRDAAAAATADSRQQCKYTVTSLYSSIFSVQTLKVYFSNLYSLF